VRDKIGNGENSQSTKDIAQMVSAVQQDRGYHEYIQSEYR